MIKLSKDNYKRQLSIHGWAGLLFGFLLYVIVFTGGIVVFITELSQWSVSGHVVEQPLNPKLNQSIDSIVVKLIKEVPPDYQQNISIHQTFDNYLFISFKQIMDDESASKESVFKEVETIDFLVNPSTLTIVQNYENIDIHASSWVRFIRKFHTDLYIPGFLSRYIVGLFGMLLLIATISGFLLHRHLIKDIFLSPRLSSKIVSERDGHNLAGTWSLPFAFVLAFTGAYICFDTRIGLPVMVMTIFEGDVDAAMNHVLRPPKPSELPTSALHASVDDIIKTSINKTSVIPIRLEITGYGNSQTLITTYHPSLNIDNDIFYHELVFNGNDGRFVRETANVGYNPSVSSRSVQLMEALHYGNFSGWLSKLIWFVLSALLCHVILSGFRLWFARRLKQPRWQRLYLSLPIISYGLPIAFMCSGIGYFMSLADMTKLSQISAIWYGFGVGWLLCLLVLCRLRFINLAKVDVVSRNAKKQYETVTLANAYLSHHLDLLTVIICLLMPFMRWQVFGFRWSSLIDSGNTMVVIIDVFFIFIAVRFLVRFLNMRFHGST